MQIPTAGKFSEKNLSISPKIKLFFRRFSPLQYHYHSLLVVKVPKVVKVPNVVAFWLRARVGVARLGDLL